MTPEFIEATIAGASKVLAEYKQLGLLKPSSSSYFLQEGIKFGIRRSANPGYDVLVDSVRVLALAKGPKSQRIAAELHGVLCDMASEFLSRGELPPKGLREYAIGLINGGYSLPTRRGRCHENANRNICICVVIELVVLQGFKATRNSERRDTADGPSGCSIVMRALKRVGIHLTERGVEAIWERPI